MFRKRLFKDILIAISGSFRTGTSNTVRHMTSFLGPRAPGPVLTMGELGKRVRHNKAEDGLWSSCLCRDT
ncbi:unnamed protein product [Lota lota]